MLRKSNSVSVQECHLKPSLRDVYEQFLRKANPDLIWHDTMSSHALQEIEKPGTFVKKGSHYVKYGATRVFEKGSQLPMEKKVLQTLYKMVKYWRKVGHLNNGLHKKKPPQSRENGSKLGSTFVAEVFVLHIEDLS
ncbi:hypothetical protein TELCIR_02611 [Teladorsagia circumcincta]|uniref:Uncharacterized protein n=1 Tax=Teladorsagia circumcincta TaxID=45464 RepID=A0A2G9UYN8_TELCI|nr:hypothetical protein TELCIR_02611 [Teladorsagia circumcincta]